MPSRKLTAHCHRCGYKNHIKALFCNQCGERQREERVSRDAEGRTKLYADIAHPINTMCREMIQARVIAEFQAELERSKQPGYASRYDDDYGYEDVDPHLPGSGLVKTNTETAPPPVIEGPRENVVPPPHLRTSASTTPENSDSASAGPHFKPGEPEAVRRGESAPSNDERRSDFGAGILD